MRPLRYTRVVFRWAARILGALILGYVVLDVLGSGLPNLGALTRAEALQMASFGLTLVGCGVLWKWELLGGLLAVGGMTMFYGVNYAYSGQFPKGWVLALFFLPGALALTGGILERFAPPEGDLQEDH